MRVGLVSVATRPLICPVCNEVLLGIDKLTIHLFGHTINLSSGIAESSEPAEITAADEHLVAVHNVNNVAPQNWNILKHLDKTASNSRLTESSDSDVSNVGNDTSIVNSQLKASSSMKDVGQSSLVSDYNRDVIKVNVFPQSDGNHDAVQKANLQQGALKTNCATQYFCNDNIRHLNLPQKPDTGGVQVEKVAISESIITTKVIGTVDTNIFRDIGRECIEPDDDQCVKKKLMTDLIEEKHLPNFHSIQNVMTTVCARGLSEKHNGKENLPDGRKTILETNAKDQSPEHRLISQPSTKAFRTIAPKEKTERCNVCGFHFLDTNILTLHKQLVHEQDSSNSPERIPKNYYCHLCSKVFKMRGSLMIHMRVAHIGHNSGK